MQIIDIDNIKASKKVKTIINDQQKRIWKLERALDDLGRAAEIAQYSGQYSVIDTYRAEAEELLKDRITLPELDTSMESTKYRILTGEVSDETSKAINEHIAEKAKVAAGVKT